MPDEHSDKIVSLLEEIRDLTKERNSKLESYVQTVQTMRQRHEEALQRHKEAQERALSQRCWFLWILGPLLLLAIGFMIYLAFWVIPDSEATQSDKEMQDYRMMIQSNYMYMTNLWPNKSLQPTRGGALGSSRSRGLFYLADAAWPASR